MASLASKHMWGMKGRPPVAMAGGRDFLTFNSSRHGGRCSYRRGAGGAPREAAGAAQGPAAGGALDTGEAPRKAGGTVREAGAARGAVAGGTPMEAASPLHGCRQPESRLGRLAHTTRGRQPARGGGGRRSARGRRLARGRGGRRAARGRRPARDVGTGEASAGEAWERIRLAVVRWIRELLHTSRK
ncbi:hypothetical protein BS78_01G264000 [Paspalum vaginatum]|nr:hypothetical protein BS78_01G264000 [Paspalum vaginatum]